MTRGHAVNATKSGIWGLVVFKPTKGQKSLNSLFYTFFFDSNVENQQNAIVRGDL